MHALSFHFYKVQIAYGDLRDTPWFAEGTEDMKDPLVVTFDGMQCHGMHTPKT